MRRVLVTVLWMMASPAVAHASEPDAVKVQTAAQEFDAGRRAFQLEDFASAAAHFENAFRDMPSPEALRLAIRSHDMAGNAARAATLAALAIRQYPEDTGTAQLAESFVKKLAPRLHRVVVACDPACAIVLDKRAVFDEPAERAVVYVQPGKHVVVAVWPGDRQTSRTVDGRANAKTDLSLRAETPEPKPRPNPVAPAPAAAPVADGGTSSGIPPVVTYVGLGVTGVLAGVTVWSGIDTKNSPGRDVVEERCLDLGESCPAYQEGLDAQKRTNILLGATLGCAATTGVLALFTNWGGDEASAAVGPAVFVGGSGVVASGRF